ncbi:hypothetical protein ONS95_009325 [Cadophora gregata]|uniref:uncharacterized protein n=1 Tax=Cadophora gregata TaxID=51156 RepID=UPI0026DCC884|nr:uncharacterized protein ONS95_009325 [Cadophora gregata]KAK0124357.1 hypothetical protein ONS95_009325 [Cadophora gregata]
MFSTFPSTPGRGRSRFSKVLPVPPGEASNQAEKSPVALTPRSFRTELPPLPRDAAKPSMAIPRRPVGSGAGGDVKSEKPARTASTASVSSMYSDSPGVSRSLSGSSSTKDSPSGVDSPEDGPTPPLPPKGKDRQNSDEKADSQKHKASSNSISSFDNAVQPTEIWRRRSGKSDRSIAFPDLILSKSNGSTASPPRRQEQTTDRAPPPKSITARRPVPARPAPQALMGNKLAKLKTKGSREDSNDEDPASAPKPYESIQRLPTPEYLKADKQQPITPSILSPVSPFTPPDDKPPLVPRKSESRSLAVSHGSSDATIVAREIVAPHTPTQENDPPFKLSAHTRDGSDALAPQPLSGKTSPLALPSPASHAAYFPTIRSPAAYGTIFPCPELDLVHLDCYQSHKLMRGCNNKVCPTACMVCERRDTEKRWRCAWCCLSACGSCIRVLDSVPGKDLRLALERIGK